MYVYNVLSIVKTKKTYGNHGFKTPKDYFDNFEERLLDKIPLDNQQPKVVSDMQHSGLKAPESYFDTLDNKILEEINITNEKSSTLTHHIQAGFHVPEKYFDTIEKTIAQKTVSAHKNTTVVSLFSRKNIAYISGIAAMVAIIISLSINKKKDVFSFETLDIVDIQKYVEEGNATFSDTEIAELLDDTVSFTDTLNDNEISDEELENYLSDENLEDDSIYIE